MIEQSRFPLTWPVGWKRTPRHERHNARFRRSDGVYQRQLSVGDAVTRLLDELRRLRVREGDVIISTNVKLRLDGLPYSNQPEPDDVGAAVYFRLNKNDRVLACDVWRRVADNVAAIAAHVSAIRAIDRYGVGTIDQAFAGYAALPARGTTWRSTLGFEHDAVVTLEMVQRAFRDRARSAHPDVAGGSHDAMASLTQAKIEAEKELYTERV